MGNPARFILETDNENANLAFVKAAVVGSACYDGNPMARMCREGDGREWQLSRWAAGQARIL
jgi:hypothetical protein